MPPSCEIAVVLSWVRIKQEVPDHPKIGFADMEELPDSSDLGSDVERRVGWNPTICTN